MADRATFSNMHFTPASPADRERGLLGYVSVVLGGLVVIDSICLRRTRDNRLTLSFPEREDGLGRRHPLVRPVDDDARRAIEAAIIAAIGWKQGGPS
jgi:hypothetical protein